MGVYRYLEILPEPTLNECFSPLSPVEFCGFKKVHRRSTHKGFECLLCHVVNGNRTPILSKEDGSPGVALFGAELQCSLSLT